MVTRGSQMAIYLAAAALISSGDAVAVEEPGYPYAWEAFRAAGARVIGVPVDALGIDVARLENLAQQEPKLKALYVTPHHQYPTTVTLGASRRLRLLEVARRYGLSIVEDDYDHEYRFDGRPVLPLASRANDSVPVIYIGSLSKLLSPAVRLGYVSARPDILQRMIKRREAIDRQGDLLLESAMAELICNGTLARHARKARRVYEVRRNILVTELKERLGQDIAFNTPSGGLAVWLVVRDGLSANAWAPRPCVRVLRFLLHPASCWIPCIPLTVFELAMPILMKPESEILLGRSLTANLGDRLRIGLVAHERLLQ